MNRFLAYLWAALALVTAAPAWGAGMVTPLMYPGPTTALSTSADRYLPLVGGQSNALTPGSANTNVRTPMPVAGVFSNMRTRVPGITGGTMTVTLQKNGSNDALTTANTSGSVFSDNTHTVSVTAGDDFNFRFSPSGVTGTLTVPQVSLVFTSSADNKSFFLLGHGAATTETLYMAPWGVSTTADSTTTTATGVMPTGGTIAGMYARLSAAPGTGGSGKSVTYTIYKNGTIQDGSGGSVDTRLTISETAQTGNNSFTLTWSAGDTITVERVGTNTPASSVGMVGLAFNPTTNGESVQGGSISANLTNSLDRIANATGRTNNNAIANEANTYNLAPVAFTAKSLYANVPAAPGGSASWAFTLRSGATPADTTLTTTISAAATSNSDTTHTPSISDSDLMTMKISPASAPTTTTPRYGWVAYVTPVSGNNNHNLLLLGVGQ